MKRTEDHVTQFLFAELGTSGSTDGSRRLVIKVGCPAWAETRYRQLLIRCTGQVPSQADRERSQKVYVYSLTRHSFQPLALLPLPMTVANLRTRRHHRICYLPYLQVARH